MRLFGSRPTVTLQSRCTLYNQADGMRKLNKYQVITVALFLLTLIVLAVTDKLGDTEGQVLLAVITMAGVGTSLPNIRRPK